MSASAPKPSIISLYTGAGGLDYGLEAAGFDTRVAVEMDRNCVRTLKHNRRWPVIDRDILTVPTDEILEKAELKPGEADLLIGGPPCQPFSKSGFWANGRALRLDDPRAATLGAYLRVLKEAKPRAFVLENVEGLAYRGKDEGLQLLLGALDEINKEKRTRYKAVVLRLNAAEYGVPQLRQRVFVIGSRDGLRMTAPPPTHSAREEAPSFDSMPFMRDLYLPPFRTAWDALADVTPEPGEDLALKGKWAEILPSIPEGQNYLWHTDRMGGLPLFGWRRRYWSFLLKLAKDLPSWTIQAQPGPATGPFHWDNRRLSARELCRLQTFPDSVSITGTILAQQRQIGNAVPSLLAEVLGRRIRTELLDLKPIRTSLKLMPPDRSPAPPEEKTVAVPKKFRVMTGAHEAHPGTGKGYRAAIRPGTLEI